MESVRKVYLQNYCNFSGRASRSEFWWAFLAQYVVIMVIYFIFLFLSFVGSAIITATCGDASSAMTGLGIMYILLGGILMLVGLALMLPILGVAVRRLHDTGKSGWFYLVCLIPFVNLILYYWWALPSEMYENQYGPVPNLVNDPWDNDPTFPAQNNNFQI